MKPDTQKPSPQHDKRLIYIGIFMKELRYSRGLKQDDFLEYGLTRRQVQTAEAGKNITLKKLFTMLDCYECSLKDVEIFEN